MKLKYYTRRKILGKQNVKLTHDLNFQCSTCAVTLCITCHASIGCLVAHSFNIFDDECAIREDLLFSVDWQDPGISFPNDTFDRVSSNRTSDTQSFSSNDSLLVHMTNKRQTINVETGRMLGSSNLTELNIAQIF